MLENAAAVTFVPTADRSRARPFYSDVLGIEEASADDFAVVYRLGGGTMMRLTDIAGHVAHPHTILGWLVDDIEAVVDGLTARGVSFAKYDGFGQDDRGIWTDPGSGTRIAWFHDPDGNNLSLTQFG